MWKFIYFLSNSCTFSLISCTIGVNLVKIQDRICVQMLKQTEGCEKQMFFISLIPCQTIYAFLLRISKCREIRVFWRICFCLKNCSRGIFFWQILCMVTTLSIRLEVFSSRVVRSISVQTGHSRVVWPNTDSVQWLCNWLKLLFSQSIEWLW